ncbi:MAG: helix-turn-helix domain-containing protein, partial [Clostridia bacterium]|nr:helix-turn-helix domain-containing protein [Clostridia bacterium]
MSNVISQNKNLNYSINLESDTEDIFKASRALASYDRIRILQLLTYSPMSIYEISKTLNIPISTVSNHISILEEAKILFVSTQQGVKKHVKMCNRQI